MRDTAASTVEDSAVRLIVNADDLGMSRAVNAGIEEAHRHGIVTSASLMVLRPAAGEAAEVARRTPSLDVGLHLEADEPPGEGELRAQLGAFRALLGRDPTHLDSHHHVHLTEPVRSAARRIAAELGVPLRGEPIRYEGGYFGRRAGGEPWPEAVSAERLVELIEALPAGVTELGCHPGRGVGAESSYASERELELAALCDRRVRQAVEAAGVELISFSDLR